MVRGSFEDFDQWEFVIGRRHVAPPWQNGCVERLIGSIRTGNDDPNVSSFALHDDDAADPVLGRVVAQGRGTKDLGRLDPYQ
jgi:hypothetical protein